MQLAVSAPPPDTYVFGPTRVHTPNGISIGSAVFAGPPQMDGHVTPFLAFGTPSIFWNGCRLLQFIE